MRVHPKDLTTPQLKHAIREMIRVGRIEISGNDPLTGTPTARWDSSDASAFALMAELSRRTGQCDADSGVCDLCQRYAAVVAVHDGAKVLAERACADCVAKPWAAA
jgi:hypothetical protein